MSEPDAYEPPPDVDDERPSSGGYLTFKELRWVGAALIVLILALLPIYRLWKSQAEQHICAQNLAYMFDAIGQYAVDHEDRLPPAYDTAEGIQPALDVRRRPSTWATKIDRYMDKRGNFECPTADPAENVRAQSADKVERSLVMSYGMYTAMALAQQALVARPAGTVLIAETANRGAGKTYDPHPFGSLAPDGFIIGWDTGNEGWTPETRTVTRLAFPGSSDGLFSAKGSSRHGKGIHFLFADGHLETLSPPAALVEHLPPRLTGLWADR
jgi:prepilin-type processing-associated H-X9-DG protein